MILPGNKLRSVESGGLMFLCPGCGESHLVYVGAGYGPRWGYNGNPERPTFTPSIRIRGIKSPSGDEMTPEEEAEYDAIYECGGREAVLSSRFGTCCHSFVTSGRIQFLADCTHALAGQTVDLPEWRRDA
jgi:hypothetical protein